MKMKQLPIFSGSWRKHIPSNESTSAAQSTQIKCTVSKAKTINNAKKLKQFDSYLSIGFTQDGD
jgi:hypothetical protein